MMLLGAMALAAAATTAGNPQPCVPEVPRCKTDDADVIIDTTSKGLPLSGEPNGLIQA